MASSSKKSIDPNSYFANTYARSAPAFVKGKGVQLVDESGKQYLDFGSGVAVTALGHTHPALVKVLKEQGAKLLHVSNHYFAVPQIELAKLLIKHSFGDKVFLCNSGTEAIEACIKFARKRASAISANKYHVLSFIDGFHGRTYGALSATAQKKFHEGFGPMLEGFHYAPWNDVAAAKAILDAHEFAAIIIEPIQGESGINAATPEMIAFLRQYATEKQIALVFDEIQCGMARTGTLWAYEQYGVAPDLMALAKPLGGGLPLGAVVCKEEFVKTLAPGDHGTTFGGNPLACALGVEVLKLIAAKSFLASVRQNGAYLKKQLQGLAKSTGRIKAVLGTGLMVGVRMNDDMTPIVARCKAEGLLVLKAGNNTIRFLPPLTVTKKEIDKAVAVFAKALTA